MILPPRARKLALAMHLTCSVGWIGAVLAYLALAAAAAVSLDGETVHAAWIAMELTGWYVIVPLAVTALATGIVMALGTRWGLFRYYWVAFSLALTVVATVVLLLHMPTVSVLAQAAGQMDGVGGGRPAADLVHPGAGLLVLLLVLVLNVYKPPGMTRYGWRKHLEQRGGPEDRLSRARAEGLVTEP